MTYSPDTPILGNGSNTVWVPREAKRPRDVADYQHELIRLCRLVGFNEDLLIAQAAHETANFTSVWWDSRLNPAGIGITGDPRQDAASQTFATGGDAARAQIVHMAEYLGRALPTAVFPKDLTEYDHRLPAINEAELEGTVRVLGDLGNGKWAVDPKYAQKIANVANRIFEDPQGETPVAELNMTKGLIPLPDHTEAFVDVGRRDQSDRCRGYDRLGWRADPPHGVTLHRPQAEPNQTNEGYLDGRCCPALFDFEILANGQAKRFARLGDFASGWANGRVSSPYGDALKYLQHYGFDYNRVNRDWESVEVGGWFLQPGVPSKEQPITEAQWAWVAHLIASRAHDYGIRWDTFPIIPAENGRSYVTWHQEWTIGTGKVCPGATLMNGTPALIERASQIMRAAQTAGATPKPPAYAASELPDWWAEELAKPHPGDQSEDGVRYRVLRRNYRVKVQTTRRSRPDPKAPVSGPKLPEGELIFGERLVTAGSKDFVLTQDGHYVLASKVSPKPSLRSW